MECACTFGSLSVAYFFRVTVTLTSRLSSRRIMSEAYLILFDVGIPNSVCGYTLVPRSRLLLSGRCHHDLLDSILEKSCPEHISYIICGMNPKFSE